MNHLGIIAAVLAAAATGSYAAPATGSGVFILELSGTNPPSCILIDRRYGANLWLKDCQKLGEQEDLTQPEAQWKQEDLSNGTMRFVEQHFMVDYPEGSVRQCMTIDSLPLNPGTEDIIVDDCKSGLLTQAWRVDSTTGWISSASPAHAGKCLARVSDTDGEPYLGLVDCSNTSIPTSSKSWTMAAPHTKMVTAFPADDYKSPPQGSFAFYAPDFPSYSRCIKLDVEGGSLFAGSCYTLGSSGVLAIWQANSTGKSEQFIEVHTLGHDSPQCMAAEKDQSSTSGGNRVDLQDCKPSNKNQLWSFDEQTGHIAAADSTLKGQCVAIRAEKRPADLGGGWTTDIILANCGSSDTNVYTKFAYLRDNLRIAINPPKEE